MRRGCFMKKSFQRVIATLNLFQGKQSLTIFLLAAIFALSACDDSSSASDDNKESSAVESSSSVKSSSDDSVGSTIVSSNSAKNEQGNDSSEKDNSSNGKSSSSGSDKNKVDVSSSSTVNTTETESSSSDVVAGSRCEKEGDSVYTQWGTADKMYVVKCVDGRWKAVRYFRLDSSQVVQKTREEKEGLDSVFNPDVEYGEFKDERDGNVYKTITFVDEGNTRTMFAQNLNYGTFVKLGENADAVVQKHCYDDDEWYCDHFFGGLYTWSEAFGLPRACDMIPTGSSVECPDTIWTTAQLNGWRTIKKSLWKGLCPEGWHILTENEWVTAGVQQITGTLVDDLSKSTWWYEKDANNKTGTSLLAAGYAEDDPIQQRGDSSVYKYERTAFWLSSDVYGIDSIGANIAMSWFITAHHLVNEATVRSNRFRKTAALSIRCITD